MDNQNQGNPLTPPPATPVAYVSEDTPKSPNPVWQTIKSSKLLKIGLPLLIVALLPVVVLLAQERQTNQSRASKATILSFTPNSTQQTPLKVKEGESVDFQIMVDPGTNLVSSVSLIIEYNKDSFTLVNESDFSPNQNVFPTMLNKSSEPGLIRATLSIGDDPTKAIQTPTQIATLKLKAKEYTQGRETVIIKFGDKTQVLSVSANDQYNENVLSSTIPAVVNINKGDNSLGKVKGLYLDKADQPLILPNMRASLYKQGQNENEIQRVIQESNTGSPEFEFTGLKPGRYRMQVANLTGYDSFISVCRKKCNEEKPKYTRDYSVKFEVTPNKDAYVGVKYMPSSSVQAIPGTTVSPTMSSITPTGQITAVACTSTTADVNSDNVVTYLDYSTVSSCVTTPGSVVCQKADTDKDGKINAADQKCVADIMCTNEIADVNKDNNVTSADYQLVGACYNKNAEGTCLAYDFNKSGKVDLEDLNCVQKKIPTPTPTVRQ